MRRPDQRGFTVVELLVVIVILGVVGSVVTTSLVNGMRTTRQTQSRIEAMAELRTATERITRELRAACPLESMAVDDVTLQLPRDGQRYRYQYTVDADALNVTVELRDPDDSGATDTDGDGVLWLAHRPEQPLIDELSPSVDPFTYRAPDETILDPATAAPRDVATVDLTLERTLPEQDPVTVTTRVHVRNGGLACA